MKTYTAILAEDVPHYATVEIRAKSAAEAIEAAKALVRDDLCFEPDWDNAECRIVEISDDESCQNVAHDLAIDDCFFRDGGEREPALSGSAQELLAVLQEAHDFPWVCNAALTDDIDALRKICLAYADWWNGRAWPAIEKAKRGVS